MNRDSNSFSGSEQFQYEGHDLEAMQVAGNYYHWILDLFGPFRGDHILEVGAGTGNLCSIILEKWHDDIRQYIALEPDPKLFRQLTIRCKNIPGIELEFQNWFLSDGNTYMSKKEIDTILYVNVLEHVENDRAELERAAALLKKDGHLLTFTPAMPSLYSRLDNKLGHYRRYRLEDMKQKISHTGLKVVKAHYVDFVGFFLWWFKYRVLKHSKIQKEQVRLFDRTVVPILKKFDPSRYLPLGKNVMVIGKKI